MPDVFELVGGYGWYQLLYTSLIATAIALGCTSSASVPFLFADIPHRCAHFQLQNTAPYHTISTNASSVVEVNATSFSPTTTSASALLGLIPDFSESCEAGNDLQSCYARSQSVEYDCCYPYRSTVVSEFDLICEREHLRSLGMAMLGLGYLFGSIVFGQLSDKIGRRKVALLAVSLRVVTLTAICFTTTYVAFIPLFFLSCALDYGTFLSCYILLVESVGSRRRIFGTFKVDLASTTSEFGVCALFYYCSGWRQLPLISAVTGAVAFVIILCVPESPLWLAANGCNVEAEKVINRMARMNGRPPPDMQKILNETGKKLEVSAIDLFTSGATVRFKTLIIMFNWFVITSAFYAVFLNITSLHEDPYMSFMYSAAVSMPSVVISYVGIQFLGRRPTFCVFISCGALSGLLIIVMDQVPGLTLFLSVSAKFFFGAAFGVLYIWSSELYPTPTRNAGMGVSSVCGRIGLLLVPFALEFGTGAQACVGLLGFVSAALSLILPETLGQPMPQTIEESKTVHLRTCGVINVTGNPRSGPKDASSEKLLHADQTDSDDSAEIVMESPEHIQFVDRGGNSPEVALYPSDDGASETDL